MMTTTFPKTPINIFVASSSELDNECKESIHVIHELRNVFPLLDLDTIRWNTALPSGSYNKQRIQDEINPLLDKCQIVLVLFYSKIGQFTLEEYRLAREKNKKIFLYFKTGFAPKNKKEHDELEKVFEFRDEIERENQLIFRDFNSTGDFKNFLYKDLNIYLSQNFFPVPVPASPLMKEPDEQEIRRVFLQGSRAYYEALRGPNGRFRYLKISDILFTGTETKWLEACVELDEKSQDLFEKRSRHPQKLLTNPTIIEVLPILWKLDVKHTVIVGDGGMGKTVSLLQWWENLLESGEKLKPVPIFIALNEFNQVSEARREGFILETIRKNYGLGKINLEQIESLMKTPLQQKEEFIPSIVLLLDGFNEITTEKRQMLIELNRLAEQYPGIQLIMTSRNDMRGNFNWNHWHPVRLKELEEDQVKTYLQEHSMTGTAVSGKGKLGKLIKNPMMLTLYAASCEVQVKHRDSRYCSFKDRVESPGELLWNFIEAQVALLPEKVGPGEDRVFYYWFLLKYLLPGLGFEMEKAGLFAFTYSQFRDHLDKLCLRFSQGEFLDTVPQLDKYIDNLPLSECADEKESRKRAAFLRDIFCGEMHMLVEEGETLRFLHQDFRDFFAAVHILKELEVGIRKKEIPGVLKERILDYYVRRYIGEIEEEHRCIPYLVEEEGWKIDINTDNRLYKALELCRGKFGEGIGYAVCNVVTIWKEVRGELTGADLSNLDLSGVMLNEVRCSRYYDHHKGEGSGSGTRYLGVEFGGSRVHGKSLLPLGHTNKVNSAVYSRDGKKILSASNDNTIKEWDAETGVCVKTLAGHKYGVNSAVYSGDGKKILSASSDNTIKEWDAGTGVCVKTLAGHERSVNSAVYSGDGKKILSASNDNTIKEWDSEPGECLKTLTGHERSVNSAVYSSDGKKILSASWDHTIKEWDAENEECVKTLVGHTDPVFSAVYSIDSKKILSTSGDGTIKEWDVETGECVKTLREHLSIVTSAVYSEDSKKILTASLAHNIKEWDAETGECLKILAGHNNWVTSAVYSGDGKKILSASSDNTIKEWDAGTGVCVKFLAGHTDKVWSAVYSSDGKKILSASNDHTIKEWDTETGVCVKTLAGHKCGVNSAVYSGDGKKILSASWNKIIKEWDAGTGQCLKTLHEDDNPNLSGYSSIIAKLKTNDNKIIVPVAPGEVNERELLNIPGLFIQGCSFQNLEKGSQWSEKGLEILRMYGGKV
ncbi:MAG TPA: NACHT domain-containing protein [Candidatus Deferrimicrobium sp.]|nr:NACHT domain-containing protein [Candidatus Deferrimicrobium sp.]